MNISDAQLRQMWLNKQRRLTAQPLAEILPRLVASQVKSSPRKADRIQAVLAEVLPARLHAAVTLGPQRTGTLTLLCKDGGIRFEILQRESVLLKRFQEILGRQAPHKLRVVVSSES